MQKKHRKRIVSMAKAILDHRLATLSQGNISFFDRNTSRIFITPSAILYADMKPRDICVLDGGGKVLKAKWQPTSELMLHLAIYRSREDITAIIHTHPPYCAAFAVVHREIVMKLTEGIMVAGNKVPMAGYQRPGTKELADTVTYVLGRGSAVIMANHGLVCVGASLEQALEVSLAVESSARTEIYAALLGGKPIGVPRSEASLLREHYLENYKPHPV